MNLVTRQSIGKIMFCYAIAYEHYQNEEHREKLLTAIEQLINQYFPVQLFTAAGNEVTVIRQSDRNQIYAIRQSIEAKLPKFNEILVAKNLHSSGETILSFLFYLVEEFLEKTTNADRYRKWKELEAICELDPAYTGVNEEPDYMGRVEQAYIETISEVLQAVNSAKAGVKAA